MALKYAYLIITYYTKKSNVINTLNQKLKSMKILSDESSQHIFLGMEAMERYVAETKGILCLHALSSN